MRTSLIVKAEIFRSKGLLITVGLILALAFSLSAATMMTERMIKESTVRAAESFDLIIGAKNSPTALLFGTVYLWDESLPMVPAEIITELKKSPGIEWFAPMTVGDRAGEAPIVGTTESLATFGGTVPLHSGRMFAHSHEAVVGAGTGYRVGDRFFSTHGRSQGRRHEHREAGEISVVGVLDSTGTPWDKAVLVPIEYSYEAHGIPLSGGRLQELSDEALKTLPGFSAVIVKPKSVSDAYKLHGKFNKTTFQDNRKNFVSTTGIFTGEVLVSLFAVLNSAGKALTLVNLLTLVLGLIVVLASGWIISALRADSFTQLRLLGAPPSYIRKVIFSLVLITVAVSLAFGCVLAFAEAEICAYYLSQETGIVMHPTLSFELLQLVFGTFFLACLCAYLQSKLIARKPLS